LEKHFTLRLQPSGWAMFVERLPTLNVAHFSGELFVTRILCPSAHFGCGHHFQEEKKWHVTWIGVLD
jgi:hypothetical protein